MSPMEVFARDKAGLHPTKDAKLIAILDDLDEGNAVDRGVCALVASLAARRRTGGVPDAIAARVCLERMNEMSLHELREFYRSIPV